eukprot:964142-Pleurochrysis_carterae.AAC.2
MPPPSWRGAQLPFGSMQTDKCNNYKRLLYANTTFARRTVRFYEGPWARIGMKRHRYGVISGAIF